MRIEITTPTGVFGFHCAVTSLAVDGVTVWPVPESPAPTVSQAEAFCRLWRDETDGPGYIVQAQAMGGREAEHGTLVFPDGSRAVWCPAPVAEFRPE